ncbi:NUDIX domain-containing protein [Actinomycetospora corticicola]|uniref:ADP-ribose pyrophosphatase YjhB (NUDIX family) n=1 Tax=Actinomycetospora corticicola TaxID=663602 RepID=A0A7Y9DVP1_9PSEU|nr:ADP-ribose pyrophosphatase YjhB (NUDIX family) [Actinomycetospora corticicola]
MWRDETGRSLADYPHPSVAVDVALLTVVDGALHVALHRRAGHAAGELALPGTFVRIDETLAAAALRALREHLGVSGRSPEQLRVFDDPARDDRGRVLAVAHVDLVDAEMLPTGTETAAVDRCPTLAFDHDAMVAAAAEHVRARHRRGPDPAGLLGRAFTLAELQGLHEAVLGGPLPKDTFRRHVLAHLEPTGEVRTGTVGKPARLYRRTAPGVRTNAHGHQPSRRGTH